MHRAPSLSPAGRISAAPLLALSLAACAAPPPSASQPAPRGDAPQALAPADPEVVARDAAPELGAGYRPIYRLDPERDAMVFAWEDATEGPVATLVYVTRSGGRGEATRPAALVFSSDPANAHFRRDTSPTVTVRRLYRAEMARLLERLGRRGLETLPWEPQDYNVEIGPERALYLYREGERRRAVKHALPHAHLVTFTGLERELIAVTLGR